MRPSKAISPPAPPGDETRRFRVLSLGGGVQSATMALLAAHGGLCDGLHPDAAIFADTGNEPPSTLRMIRWLSETLPWPVHVVRAEVDILTALSGGIDAHGRPTGGTVPMFTVNDKGKTGMMRRLCTGEWKAKPIRRKVRELLGVAPRRRVPAGTVVEMWIGISYDEIERMRTAEDVWQENRYPLIEASMSRHDCVQWWAANAPAGAPPLARSACVICPYHSDREWLRLQDEHPEMVEAAAQAEAGLRARQEERGYGHIQQYLHVRRVPLIEALDTAREAGERQPSMFGNECEGLCGI